MESSKQIREKLEGMVEKILFSSPKGDYSVYRIKLDGQRGSATVTMYGPVPLAGQQLVLEGSWVEHVKYGSQFEAHKMEVVAPASIEGIEKYLLTTSAGKVKQGAIKKLVRYFGIETLEILDYSPSRVREVPGIGKKTAALLLKIYRENAEQRQIMNWLEEHDVSGAYAGSIFHAYGSSSIKRITENPYCLAQDIREISFTVSDVIAASLGIESDDEERIFSGLDYQLLRLSQEGHCCVPENHLVETAARLLGVKEKQVRETLMKALSQGLLEQECIGPNLYVYHPDFYKAEIYVADGLLYLNQTAESFRIAGVSEQVKKWESLSGVELAESQRKGVEQALTNGILVLTGGPGTGKTTVIRAMIEIMEAKGLTILLGAPTGRAAKRMEEATDRKAYTIHRLLEANSSDDEEPFARNEQNPLEADAIILDEVSMMDIMLMQAFLSAVPEGCHVVLVGDVDQLPSVGPGSVLKDIIRSGKLPEVHLTEIFRQEETSNIVVNAHAINKGRIPLENMKQKDFYFREINDARLVEDDIVRMVCEILPSRGYDDLDDVQVLAPMHRGACGVERLNIRLQYELNPPDEDSKEWTLGDRIFREGDKVMQMRNNYEKKVFNGDIGYIQQIDNNKMKVDFGWNIVEYEKAELIDLQLAYCISVHKSQGSEYKVVVMPLVPGHYVMLQRNLLYTAITRAKNLVILEGTRPSLITAVENDRTRMRYSLLTERLCEDL